MKVGCAPPSKTIPNASQVRPSASARPRCSARLLTVRLSDADPAAAAGPSTSYRCTALRVLVARPTAFDG